MDLYENEPPVPDDFGNIEMPEAPQRVRRSAGAALYGGLTVVSRNTRADSDLEAAPVWLNSPLITW